MAEHGIVVIGDEDAVFGLGLIGLRGQVVTNLPEARRAIRNAMADSKVALILITENWSEARPEAMSESGPLLVEIPSSGPAKPSEPLEAQIGRALGVRLEH